MTTRDSDSEHTNGGASVRPRNGFEDIPTRILIEDLAIRSEVHDNRLTAAIEDSKARDARTQTQLRENAATLASVQGGVLELVGRAHRQDAEIARVRASIPTARGSTPESEFMTEAARQGLALAKLDREEHIAARKRRNAALVKVGIGFGLAVIAALSSVVTYLLSSKGNP